MDLQSVSDVHGSDPQSGQEPLTSLREVPTPSGPPCAGGGLRRPPGGSGGDAGLSVSKEKPPLRSGYLLLIRSSLLAKEPSGSFSPPGLRADLDCFGLFWVLISVQLILAASDSELEHTEALSPSFSPRLSALDQPSRSAGVTRAGQEFRAPLARLALRLKPRRQQRWLSSLFLFHFKSLTCFGRWHVRRCTLPAVLRTNQHAGNTCHHHHQQACKYHKAHDNGSFYLLLTVQLKYERMFSL